MKSVLALSGAKEVFGALQAATMPPCFFPAIGTLKNNTLLSRCVAILSSAGMRTKALFVLGFTALLGLKVLTAPFTGFSDGAFAASK
jgi:hypothetical protein